MGNAEFTKLWNDICAKFPQLEGAYMIVVNDGDIHQATKGDVLTIMKAIIECGMEDDIIMSIFITIGEMLKSKIGDKDFESNLRKLFLEKKLNVSVN